VESPFASLTCELQSFGCVLGIHASAVGHARINGDFKRDPKAASNDGAYFKLTQKERDSLLSYALYASPAVRIEEKVLLDNQQEAKNEKQKLLRQKKMLACQKEYGDKLIFIEIANSLAFWSTKAVACREYNKLESHTTKLNAVKDQMRIRVIGISWKDLRKMVRCTLQTNCLNILWTLWSWSKP
jgi:hypothetical protein